MQLAIARTLLAAALAGSSARATVTMPEHEGYVKTDDGVRLHYRAVGQGSETVVIPVAVWTSPHFDALAHGRRVVYYDPRGRGHSDTGDLGRVGLARATRDLELLREGLRIRRMAIVGWSGYGLEIAVYALDHPSRVTRLVQLAPVPPRLKPYMDRRGEAIRQRYDQRAWEEFERMKEAKASAVALCRQYQRATLPAFFASPGALAKVDIEKMCASPNEWPANLDRFFAAFLPTLEAVDVRSRLADLRIPRLVIHAERDPIPIAGNREWVASQPEARLLVVRNADHAAFLDQPAVVLSAIETFLRGEWPDGVEAADKDSPPVLKPQDKSVFAPGPTCAATSTPCARKTPRAAAGRDAALGRLRPAARIEKAAASPISAALETR